jgi:hypothetical protein
MNNQEDFDYNEAYVVDDSDSNNGSQQVASASESRTGIIVPLVLVLFISLAFACFVWSLIERGDGGSFDFTAVHIVAFIMLLFLLCLMNITPKYEGSSNEEPQIPPVPRSNSNNRNRAKKKAMLWYTLEKDMSEEDKSKANDDVELVVNALVKLGLGKRKAIDWVNRGISQGIETSNIQGLIMYAISSGASLQNRNNK